MSKFKLKLYVTGKTAISETTITDLRRICDKALDDRYELVVIDVLKKPKLAKDNIILATPTLVKEKPLPQRRVVGDLSDKEMVLSSLGIDF